MRIITVGLIVMAALFLCTDVSAQQQPQPPECQPWIGIKSWDVSIHIHGSGNNTDSLGFSSSLQESDDLHFQVSVGPEFANTPCAGSWGWLNVQSPKLDMHIRGSASNPFGCKRDVSFSRANFDAGGGGLGMDFEKGTYFATFGLVGTASWNTDDYSGNCFPGSDAFYDVTGLSYDPTCTGWDPSVQYLILGGLPVDGGLPGSGALSGSKSFTCSSQALSSLVGFPMAADTNPFSWTITWSMTPTALNQELVVTIPQYDKWRPTAGRTEKDVGNRLGSSAANSLGIRAQLIDKDTGMASFLIPDKVTFALADVSREPGVAMNWPPRGTATSDPDLTFDCEFNFAAAGIVKVDSKDCTKDFTVTGTQIELDPADNSQPVLATLSPHDWGGWATLNVTAVVAGVAYKGSLDKDPGNTSILIPRRQPGSFIAESWKQGKVPPVPPNMTDSDDSEDSPKGDGQKGDGYTLYEEYRGFYIGCSNNGDLPQPELADGATCQHVEGDPQKKDYFIVDNIGADEGIKKFGGASGLKVHFHGLTAAEIGPAGSNSYRVTNFNHSAGAHEVDQHAVMINWGGNGPSGVVTPDDYVCPQDESHSCPALPKHIDHIEMSRKLMNWPAERLEVDVAHELAHSVDVYHHGDIDHTEFWTFDPNTKTAHAVVISGAFVVAVPITILLETANLSSPNPADFADMSKLKLDQPLENRSPKDQNGKAIPGRYVYVGNSTCKGGAVILNGQHSGDVDSFMRYDYAEAYIPNGFPNIRIWIGPGAEASGTKLTDHPVGTGVNDPKRGQEPPDPTLRPRYGNAFDGRGNDLSHIAVNDNGKEFVLPNQTCQ